MPEVSIVMNCYNGERYLKEAIDSIYAQDFQDWEIIFWDNASTDASGAIAQQYDSRLRYFRAEENVPLGAARKLAMQQARGTWVGFLDTDDLWLPNKLSTQLAALSGTEHVLCYAGVSEVTPDLRPIREVVPRYPSGDMFERQLLQFDINMVTPLLRRETLDRHGLGFDPSVTASEEYNLFIRLLAHGTACAVPQVLGVWRISPGSLTDRAIGRLHEERRYTLDQVQRENPGIADRHPAAFREAYARGDYYEARYRMSLGQRLASFRLLAGNAATDLRYGALALAALVPGLWGLIHGNYLKRKLLPRLLGVARYK
ncbi:glycosyltransferase family 2 protein [Sphingomonas sp. NPDC092331]|jgi:glycosyltransferase involved in cell wall biosynthesis|uniref:glycosyltransferase family 2 protein n=2 Tax=Bacteria TaxID=2 RepID=UPI0031F51679